MFEGLKNPVGSPGENKWEHHRRNIFKLLECCIVVAISMAPYYTTIKI